jgi:heme exporter protein A
MLAGNWRARLRRSDEISDGTQHDQIAQRTHSVSAVALRALTRRYGERTALTGVTLNLETGQTLAVLGPNGAGKTTLLRVLATLLRPHDGELEVLGHRLPADGWQVRGRLGLLAHEPMLYRELTVRENLRLQAKLHGVAPARIEELLAVVALERRGDEPLRTLSRGLVQRAAVCRTLLHEPELLLLDEPYANLDPAARRIVEPLIGASSGKTRVIVSHDPQAAVDEADLVLGLSRGRAVFIAAPADLEDGALARLYE